MKKVFLSIFTMAILFATGCNSITDSNKKFVIDDSTAVDTTKKVAVDIAKVTTVTVTPTATVTVVPAKK